MRKNLATFGAAARADIRAGSVLALGPARRTYDLLMFDAPYATGAGSVALDKLNRLGWIGPDSWVSIETAEKETVERSEEHTSELQSLMRISYAVFCLKKKNQTTEYTTNNNTD